MSTKSNWITVTESKYPWERDALDFVRDRFPAHEPYRAWANFEFIADDGSINEIDFLAFTPQGFFLVEIKSHLGRLFGDAGTWTWENEGKLATVDNPLIAANLKAKKLRSLLQRQKACQKKGQIPFIEALVFCSAPDLRLELQGNARLRVCLRDRERSDDAGVRPGILAAMMRRECPGLDASARGTHDRPMMRTIVQAMEQAGIRPSQRHRKVSDYVLERLLAEGPGYQDWLARHSQLQEVQRRVRLYLVRTGSTAEERQTIERAALREFQLLEALQHPGVLRAYGFTEHEVGPALIFEHDPLSIRLDHFLTQASDRLRDETRLDLVRQIAEVVRFAHDEKVVHRSLSPQNILVTDATEERPRIKIFNWQAGYRAASTSAGGSAIVSATSHVDRLVEDASTAYMAPEAFSPTEADNTGEHLDVFSLGAMAYHIFSGQPPATNGFELSNKLRETKGLKISSVLNGAGECLQCLVQFSTNPVVPDRTGSAVDFLDDLDAVEKELMTPDRDYVEDPNRAQIDDVLPGDLHVLKRLGQGACSVALLVQRDGLPFVLKVANDPEHNSRLRDEAEVLRKDEMRHPSIVDFVDGVEIGNRVGFLLRPVFAEKEKQLVETLGHRLRKEGRLHIELLQRFGEDLLGVLKYLEEQGIPHRDIKPDNIAVGMVGRGNLLHLVLFDFSLSRTPLENIRAGTNGYLDPLLPLRDKTKPKWDLYAERYAAAATLYEMATGGLPKWGDGDTNPLHLDCEATIDAELFDAGLREPLVDFFRKAFRRNPQERFHNAEEMLSEWRDCFKNLEPPGPLSDHADEAQLRELLANATWETQIPELGLGTRATNALDRANILTVEDLLSFNVRRLQRLRGIGNKTRREIMTAVRLLRKRLGKPDHEQVIGDEPEPPPEGIASLGVDLLAERLLRTGAREGETTRQALQFFLGLDPHADSWPSQSDVARAVNVTRARIGQLLGKFQSRWAKDACLNRLRADLAEIVASQGGVMSAAELAEAVVVARGCSEEEPQRTRLAFAVVRAAVEVERTMAEPQLVIRRNGSVVFIAQSLELANYANRLGELADRLADEDPLVAPARVLERLREIPPPDGVLLPDARLVRLAAIGSQHAEVSSKQELYPRGMSPQRAIKLAHGAIAGVPQLSVAEIRERISSRYPNAAPLPEHPELYELLKEAGFDVEWDPTGKGGVGSYISRAATITSASQSLSRYATSQPPPVAGEVTLDQADARQFEERLQRAIKDGAFLTLLVTPKNYQRATDEICRRFPVELIDLEGIFLDALREVAIKANVNWELVLQTDATPGVADWDKLMLLIGRVMPLVEQRLVAARRTMLVIYAGLLARYNRMDLLERLRDKIGRRDGIAGLWLLIPGDHQAMLDGKAVPIISPGQRAKIPESWLKNEHRS